MKITAEEHAAAIASPQGLQTLLSRVVAHVVIAVLQGVAPVLQESVMQGVPTAYRIAEFMHKHNVSDADAPKFYAAVERIKKGEPALSLDEVMARAIKEETA